MNDRLRAAFDAIHSPPEQKERLKTYLAEKTHNYQARPVLHPHRLLPALACCMICLLVGFGGAGLYFTPTSVISIDINPSMELGVNRFDRVISVSGKNEDGHTLADELDLKFLTYSDAIQTVLSTPLVTQCLEENEVLSLSVISEDSARRDEMLSVLRTCTEGCHNAYCSAASPQEVSDAHSLGLSYGKYQIFLQAQALHPELTPEQAQEMTMRQLRELAGLSASSSDSTSSQNGHWDHDLNSSGSTVQGNHSGNHWGDEHGSGWSGGKADP